MFEHSKTPTESSSEVLLETIESFNIWVPKPFIGGIIHYPGILFQASKRKEYLSDHFGTQEKQQFSPVPTGLFEETVKGVFLSLENGMSGLEKTRDVFSGKDQQKDHLEDVFNRDSFFFTDGTFSKKLVQFELLYKGGKHG